MRDSFSMANMAPQLPGLNRAEWERLEEMVRAWAWQRSDLIIYVGPTLANTDQTIGADHVAVPTGFWKVIVDPARGEALAFSMPQQSIPKGDLAPWETSTQAMEDIAGIVLPLPDGIDRSARPPIWPADLEAWRHAHSEACVGASEIGGASPAKSLGMVTLPEADCNLCSRRSP